MLLHELKDKGWFTAGMAFAVALLGAASSTAQTFSDPINVADGTEGTERVRSAADGDVALMVWEEKLLDEDDDGRDAYDVFFARSTDRGDSWSAPVNLTQTVGGDFELVDNIRPRVATANGRWIVAYADNPTDGSNATGEVYCFISDNVSAASTVGGITWTGPIRILDDGGADNVEVDIDIATDGAGNWLVSWVVAYDLPPVAGNAEDVMGAFSSDDGLTWSSPFLISRMAGDLALDFNTATEDGDGNVVYANDTWVATWKTGDSAGAPFTDEDIMVATSANGTTWSDPINVNPWFNSDNGDDDNPHITYSPSDDLVIIAWNSEEDTGGIGGDADIMVATASTSDLSTWTVMGTMNNDASTDVASGLTAQLDEGPGLAADVNGTIVGVWGSGQDDGAWEVRYAISTDGGATWTDQDSIPCTDCNDDSAESTVEASPAGTFYATFQNNDEESATVAVLDLAGSLGGSGNAITASQGLIIEGDTVTLTAPAGGTGYMWFRNGGPLSDGPRIDGVDTRFLTFSPVTLADIATYTVSYDDGSKAPVVSAPFELSVIAAEAAPAAGVIGLMLVTALLSVTALAVAVRKNA